MVNAPTGSPPTASGRPVGGECNGKAPYSHPHLQTVNFGVWGSGPQPGSGTASQRGSGLAPAGCGAAPREEKIGF